MAPAGLSHLLVVLAMTAVLLHGGLSLPLFLARVTLWVLRLPTPRVRRSGPEGRPDPHGRLPAKWEELVRRAGLAFGAEAVAGVLQGIRVRVSAMGVSTFRGNEPLEGEIDPTALDDATRLAFDSLSRRHPMTIRNGLLVVGGRPADADELVHIARTGAAMVRELAAARRRSGAG